METQGDLLHSKVKVESFGVRNSDKVQKQNKTNMSPDKNATADLFRESVNIQEYLILCVALNLCSDTSNFLA